MQAVLIVIHLMVVAALVVAVLLQRSDGGALGIGGGGGFMTGRGQANALTRATAILAAIFFATSLSLSILASLQSKPKSIIDGQPARSAPAAPGQPAPPAPGGNVLDQLRQLEGGPPRPGPAPAAPPASGAAAPPGAPPAPTNQ
jgi:preprotein translocase subunit SecG